MRIEKINEKQIRCTLNQKDLKDREIGIGELAYGTAKTRALFRDMMQQASYEVGFDADDIPLMVEAIPLFPEALVLVITKVEEPDELDTRFSCFTEEPDDEDDFYDELDEDEEDYDSLYSEEFEDEEDLWEYDTKTTSDLLDPLPLQPQPHTEPDFISLPEVLGMESRPKATAEKKLRDIILIFSFPNLETITRLASQIYSVYHGENTLYKDTSSGTYYLIIHRSRHEPEEFNKICNFFYEYGTVVKNTGSTPFYYEEHFQKIITGNAIQRLASL